MNDKSGQFLSLLLGLLYDEEDDVLLMNEYLVLIILLQSYLILEKDLTFFKSQNKKAF